VGLVARAPVASPRIQSPRMCTVNEEPKKGCTMSDMNDWNKGVIEEFRSNAGHVGGDFEGAPMLLLTTTGAKSGAQRVNPMMYLNLDGHIYVFASKAGADTSPDWYHNLVAHPEVTVELGGETFKAIAKPLEGADRDRVYAVQAERLPNFGEYEKKTTRVIPVVELVRA
jgi:deazaflavin-dependent oxidoreductase (nitroreductase family)